MTGSNPRLHLRVCVRFLIFWVRALIPWFLFRVFSILFGSDVPRTRGIPVAVRDRPHNSDVRSGGGALQKQSPASPTWGPDRTRQEPRAGHRLRYLRARGVATRASEGTPKRRPVTPADPRVRGMDVRMVTDPRPGGATAPGGAVAAMCVQQVDASDNLAIHMPTRS